MDGLWSLICRHPVLTTIAVTAALMAGFLIGVAFVVAENRPPAYVD